MTSSPPRLTPRILLVEDEALVRDTMRTVLEKAGWTVLAARDGAEALQIARDIDYKIDLVISDIVMPVMSGRQLLREMLADRPTLRVLLITGYDSRVTTDDPDMLKVPLLEKPFTPYVLLHAVEDAVPRGRHPTPADGR